MSSEAGTSEAAVATADVPPFRYTAALADRIELAWQDRWEREGTFNVPNPVGPLSQGFRAVAGRQRLFVMDMFPYPSGEGLHVGHPLGSSARTSSPDTSGCAATTYCTRWVSMPSDCRRSNTRCRPASIRPRRPTRASTCSNDSCGGSVSGTTSVGFSRPPTSATTAGHNGSFCRSSTVSMTMRQTGPGPLRTW